VRLGTSASISIYLLPPALRRFRARYPEAEVVVVTGNAAEITRAVVANALDVGIVSLPVRDRELVVTPFFRDELVAIAGTGRGAPTWPGAPAAGRAAGLSRADGRGPARRGRWPRSIDAPTLAGYPLILFEAGATLRRVIDGWFHRAGVAPRSPMELGNTEAIKKLVEAGLGLSVTSWFSVKTEVRARALTAMRLTPPLERQIGLVRRRDKPPTPALDAFAAALEDLRRALAPRRRDAP
jgi:DNA-binding transcriptional LysR family regulator